MDFKKITLVNGYVYIKWISKFGNTWDSFIDPQDLPEFIKALMES